MQSIKGHSAINKARLDRSCLTHPQRYLLQNFPHDPRTILRGISPQHRTKHLNGFFALSVIRPRADIADVRAELVDDLLDVLQLLRGEVGVIEQPVKFLAVLVLGAHEIHGTVHEAEHFMALLDTLRLMFQLRAGEIRAGQIDGFQKSSIVLP